MIKQYKDTKDGFTCYRDYIGDDTIQVVVESKELYLYYCEDSDSYNCHVTVYIGEDDHEYSVYKQFGGECGISWIATLSDCLGLFIAQSRNSVLYSCHWQHDIVPLIVKLIGMLPKASI